MGPAVSDTMAESAKLSQLSGGNAPALPVSVLTASRGWVGLRLQEIWDYRELLYFMAWREIKVRYQQTMLGAAWALIQPVFTMIIFSVVFGRIAKVPTDGIPYPLFAYAGLVPWMFFSNGMNQSSVSVVANAHVITKIYFPRMLMPLSTLCSCLLDLSVAFSLLLVMMLSYGVAPSWHILLLPLFVLLALSAAMGVGLWLSALNVKYRDVRHTLPFLTQFWMFATPIAYSSSVLKPEWKIFYALNPMVGVVEGFRWAALGAHTQPGGEILASTAGAMVLLFSGAYYFRKTERTFADII